MTFSPKFEATQTYWFSVCPHHQKAGLRLVKASQSKQYGETQKMKQPSTEDVAINYFPTSELQRQMTFL